jgi:hypothetical protein
MTIPEEINAQHSLCVYIFRKKSTNPPVWLMGAPNTAFAYFTGGLLLWYVPVKFNVIPAQAIKPRYLKMGRTGYPGMLDGITNTRRVITVKNAVLEPYG